MWVIIRDIYLGVLVLSFISVLLFQRSGHFCLFLHFSVCVCVLFAFILQMFSALLCGRIFGLRFPRDPVLYNPLQVLFRMLRWLAEHPVLPPSIFLLTTDGGLGHENMAWQFFPLLRFTLLYICVIQWLTHWLHTGHPLAEQVQLIKLNKTKWNCASHPLARTHNVNRSL